jgi:polyisoprenyl-phosphate glycosyltransferase
MFSLVIPIFNEEKLVDDLVSRTIKSIESFTMDYEVIFIDDGSTDSSPDRILAMRESNKRIMLLSLSKNFGHQAAYTAGLEYCNGDIIAMMDGDLQDPPELLPVMYKKITMEDLDIVSGKRTGRKGSRGRILYSGLFHLVFKSIGEIRDMDNYGNYSMMKRNALDALLTMKEKVRYLPGMRSFIGFRHDDVDYVREERLGGKSKMNLRKLFTLAADAIFSFSRFPIRVCLILGTLGTIVFLGAGIYVLVCKLAGTAVPGWSSTLLSIYFLGSIQLVFLGILGEYVFRSYKESQNRPVYFVRKIFGRSQEK